MKNMNKVFNVETNCEVNENLCFNTELFEKCKKGPHIGNILGNYGKALTQHPVLIDIRQIHDLGFIAHKYDPSLNRPRGFQTREDEDLNEETVEEIAMCMTQKKWDPLIMQGAVFPLPKEYRGQSFHSDGTERIYGIANLTHRLYAARKSGQTHIIAWIVDIPIGKLRKWANAEANRSQYASNPRKTNDIVGSIIAERLDPTSDLFNALKNASTPKQQEEIIHEEIDHYNVHPNTRKQIFSKLAFDNVFTPERKRWTAEFMKEYIQNERPEWSESGNANYDYITDNGVPVIIAQDEGRGPLEVAIKWAKHVLDEDNSHKNIKVCFSLAKSGKIDTVTAEKNRKDFIQKPSEIIKMIAKAHDKIYNEDTSGVLKFESFPEFADEPDMIKLY